MKPSVNSVAYSPEQLDSIFMLVAALQGDVRQIAHRSRLTEKQVRGIKRRNTDRWAAALGGEPAAAKAPKVEASDAPPPVDPIEAEQARQVKLRQIREERKDLQAVAGERSLRTMVEALFRDVAPAFVPPPRTPQPRVDASATHETLLLVLSDFHGFERISLEGTRGLNEYDAFIMCQRARKVIDTVRSIKERMERGGGWFFKRLVVAVNGDMVSGTIHDVERHSDSQNIVHSVYGVGLLLAAMLRDLAEVFPEVEVFSISGNHGRMPDARKMQSKDPQRNWDTVISLLAKECTRNVKNLTWNIPNAYAVAYDIEGYTVLQQHGHDVPPGALSIPLYGIDRQVRNLNALEAQRGNVIDVFVYSHFHNKSMTDHGGSEAIVNGCFPAGTRVATPQGNRDIETLVPGEQVFSRQGVVRTITGTTSRYAEEGLVELGVKGFYRPLRATPNHLIWAIKGVSPTCSCSTHDRGTFEPPEPPRWIAAEHLSPGDWVHIPSLPSGTSSIGTDLAWAYGLYVAEGHTLLRAGASRRHHRVELTMHLRERAVLERVQAILAPELGHPGRITERVEKTISVLTFSVSEEMAERWRAMFGHTSHGKCLPEWVFDLVEEERDALVQGWIDGDGHRRAAVPGRASATSATSVSEALVQAMFFLGNRPGDHPTIKRLAAGPSRGSDSFSVLFNHGQDSRWINGERFVRVCHRHRLLAPVQVFDLEVEDDHSFVAENVGVHNSLCGGSEWVVSKLGKCDKPAQMLVAFHEEYGITHRWPIYATVMANDPAYELPALWELTEPD